MSDYVLLNGSINVTKLMEKLKAGHTAFNRGKNNNEIYCNLTCFLNDEPDQHGNHAGIKLNSTKDGKEKDKAANEGKDVYIGNFKKSGGDPVKADDKDVSAMTESLDDLPF